MMPLLTNSFIRFVQVKRKSLFTLIKQTKKDMLIALRFDSRIAS